MADDLAHRAARWTGERERKRVYAAGLRRAMAAALVIAWALPAPASAQATSPWLDAAMAPPGTSLLRNTAEAPWAPRLALRQAEPLGVALPACGEHCTYRRNFLIPAIEVPLFVVGLNLFDRWILKKDYAQTEGLEPFFDHLIHGPWQYDIDSVWENFTAHPYMGQVMFNFARSSGLSFWWSFGYTFVGSLLWELGGETLPPSINDQVETPVGGAFLGEVLFRASVMILQSGGDSPGFWRELAAFGINPSGGFNRLLFGDRYRTAEFDLRPESYTMVTGRFGYHWSRGLGSPEGLLHNVWGGGEVELDYWMDRPGSAALPFDRFRGRAGLAFNSQGPEDTLLLNGILVGWTQHTEAWTGVTGLVGSYEDLNAGLFRAAASALGFGAMGQLNLGGDSALTGMAAVSGPLMAAGNSRKQPPDVVNEQDHHQGPGGFVGALEARLSIDRRWMIDLTAREYIILGRHPLPGWEDQTYARLSAFVRIAGPHCIGVTADYAHRNSRTPDLPFIFQDVLGVGLAYALASDEHLGLRISPPR